jgi:heat shock protein HslJ
MFALILTTLFALAACQPIVAPDQAPAEEPSALATQALMNASYSGIYGEPVSLSEGQYEDGPLTVAYIEGTELYDDLDGDGVEDAAVFLLERGGGTAAFTYMAAQLNQDGQPLDAGAVMIEDRTQIRAATIQDGQIVLEFTTRGPGDGDCCPSHVTRRAYALQDGQLTEIAEEDAELVRVSAADLDGTSWRLVELGEDEPVADDVEITIAFAGDQVGGSGGCNSYTGSFSLSEDNPFVLIVGPIASTRMACPDPAGSQEIVYFSALEAASLWGYEFGGLVIAYGEGEERDRLLFEALPMAETEAAPTERLTASTWQWVRLTDPMQQVEIDSPEAYALTFLPDGSLQIQADCNQAAASYTATDDGSIEITPGITTLAFCGPESRSEELIQKLGFAAIYFFQDGNLFIDLMADGGTLEFRP